MYSVQRLPSMTSVGLPHSGIFGSTPACGSPKLIAANHALLRLSMPRHPPCALSSLTITPSGLTACGMKTRVQNKNPWLGPPRVELAEMLLPRRFANRTSRTFASSHVYSIVRDATKNFLLQKWRKRDSNPWPSACKADALPAELFPRS